MHRFGGLVLAGLIVLACGERWHREDTTWRLLDDPSNSALHVEARFGGSSCTRFIEWRVEQSDAEVDIRGMIQRSNAEACTADEVLESETIELDAPLGDRALTGCRPDDPDVDCRFVRDHRQRP